MPCGPAAVAAGPAAPDTRPSEDLVEALRTGNRATRERAIELLAAREGSILPQVESLLADPNPEVRYAALQVLVRLRGDAWPSVYHVKYRLQDCDPAVRAEAAMVLGLVGKCGAEAVPQLICALDDTSTVVRYRAAVAFQHMEECAEPARGALERSSRCDRDGRVREAAKCALWKLDKAICTERKERSY
jgi:HEAT repeat protein